MVIRWPFGVGPTKLLTGVVAGHPRSSLAFSGALAGDAVARAQTMAGLLSASLRNSRPNFVLFNIDDTGFGDWSWNFPGSATHGAATHGAVYVESRARMDGQRGPSG